MSRMIHRTIEDPRTEMMYASTNFNGPIIPKQGDDWLEVEVIDASGEVVANAGLTHVNDFSKEELNATEVVTDARVKAFKFDPEYSNPYHEWTNDRVEARLYKQWRLEELRYAHEADVRRHEEAKKATLEWETKNKLLFFGNPEKQYLGKYGKWGANPAQKIVLDKIKDDIESVKIVTYLGANRIGKTALTTGIFAVSLSIGHYPWEDPKEVGTWIWDRLRWKRPIKGRIVGQDWEKHVKAVIISTINELWPQSFGIEKRKNNIGVDAYYTFPGGDTVEIMSNNSEASVFEGASLHWTIYDEPPTRDIRVACARGLVDNNGIELFAMTLLKEAWVDKEVVNLLDADGNPDPSVFNVHADIYNNEGFGISKEGIEQFKKVLNEDEIKSRIQGIPAYKAGLVLEIDRKQHYVDPFEVPSNWLIDVAIDIGVAKPHDLLVIATSEPNFKYVIRGEQIRGDGQMVADWIIKYIEKNNLRLNRVIVDPLAKSDRNNENSTYEKIDIHLNRFGYYLETGSKDKEDGIQRINDHLDSRYGSPSLFFFRNAGPRVFRQLENWMFDDNGKPSKEDDDAGENLYRLMLLGTKYEEPEDEVEPMGSFIPESETGRNKVTGY